MTKDADEASGLKMLQRPARRVALNPRVPEEAPGKRNSIAALHPGQKSDDQGDVKCLSGELRGRRQPVPRDRALEEQAFRPITRPWLLTFPASAHGLGLSLRKAERIYVRGRGRMVGTHRRFHSAVSPMVARIPATSSHMRLPRPSM